MRETGLSRNAVRHWLQAGTAPTLSKGERARITDPFVPYLMRRLDEGAHNATRLWRELQASGFRGGVMSVRLCVAALKGGTALTRFPTIPTSIALVPEFPQIKSASVAQRPKDAGD